MISIGIIGHVDSGKTTLAKAISTCASTASFDKSPQSQSRGITLDLGFSKIEMPNSNEEIVLVDCPGHASLFRTVIGGMGIMDGGFMLILDATKGFQQQSSECLVLIDSLMCLWETESSLSIDSKRSLIVVLNKADLVDKERLEKIENTVVKVMKNTEFFKNNFEIIKISAKLILEAKEKGSMDLFSSLTMDLFNIFRKLKKSPTSDSSNGFLMMVDHCFKSNTKTPIFTGTLLYGNLKVGDKAIVPAVDNVERSVVSIQSFKEKKQFAQTGDRIGVSLKSNSIFDASDKFERGLVSSPTPFANYEHSIGVICSFHKIKYFKKPIKSKLKYHVSIGYETVLGKIQLFKCNSNIVLDLKDQYEAIDEFSDNENISTSNIAVLITFQNAIFIPKKCFMIGSRLDDSSKSSCRLSFFGSVLYHVTKPEESIQFYKRKKKEFSIDRIVDEYTLICRGLVSGGNAVIIDHLVGMKIHHNNVEGKIEGSFGTSGKFRVIFTSPHGILHRLETNLFLHYIKPISGKIKQG